MGNKNLVLLMKDNACEKQVIGKHKDYKFVHALRVQMRLLDGRVFMQLNR
jgi:hypothetical protein